MSRILVADDEPGIRTVLRDALEQDGHEVETATDGEEAIGLLERETFELVITDLAMPKKDGLELVKALREISNIPILVLTIRQEERQKVHLLDAGADDYMTKPFGVGELLARTRALLRRTNTGTGQPTFSRWGDIEVEPEFRRVRRGGREIHLTPTEYSLLVTFLQKPGAVWTHHQLFRAVWGTAVEVSNDTLRVHIASLRRKLETDPNRPRWIRTEPWVGYRFSPEG